MAAPTATYSGLIDYSDDSTTYTTLDGATSVDFQWNTAQIDATDFDSGGFNEKVPGLIGATVTVSYDWITADTSQVAIQAAIVGRTLSYFKVLPDGSAGWIVPGYLEGYSMGMSVDGKAECTISLVSSGQVTVV